MPNKLSYMWSKMQGSIVQISTSNGGMPKLPVLEAEAHRLGIGNDAHAHPQFMVARTKRC